MAGSHAQRLPPRRLEGNEDEHSSEKNEVLAFQGAGLGASTGRVGNDLAGSRDREGYCCCDANDAPPNSANHGENESGLVPRDARGEEGHHNYRCQRQEEDRVGGDVVGIVG